MAFNLEWDEVGKRTYETGVDKGVLYPVVGTAYPKGVAWSGLSGVTETPSGAETTDIYADNIKFLSMLSAEKLDGTIEAYMYPDEFMACDGTAEITEGVTIGQQDRKGFGLCYRTVEGNDTEGNSYNYKLHLLYGCKASPSEKVYKTINDSPEATSMSWSFSTTPVNVTGKKPTALLVVDAAKVGSTKMAKLEEVLYGKAATSDSANDAVDARLPLPDEVLSILAAG